MKPKVLICGQKPRQHEHLERAFAGRARLSFFFDGNLKQLFDKARGADLVVVSIGAVSHKVTDVVKSAGGNLRQVSGGAETVKAEIERFLGVSNSTQGGTVC